MTPQQAPTAPRLRSTPQPPTQAKLINTDAFRLTQHVAAQAADSGAVAGFFGAPGTGKTYAVDHFVTTGNIDYVWITSAPKPTPREIFEELIFELDGTTATGNTRQLRRDCQDLLAERQRIVVVDEAQYLSTMWLQQLRTLHDAGLGQWALFLVGGTGTGATIGRHPELGSRLSYQVDFRALKGKDLHAALAEYHPVLAATDTKILDSINERDGFNGNLRRWVTFIRNAEPLLAASPQPNKLTAKVVKAVFATMGVR